jgi:hypothetical protein
LMGVGEGCELFEGGRGLCVCVWGGSNITMSDVCTHPHIHTHINTQVRRHTIVLNLDELRCLLLFNRLIVIVPEGGDPDW